MDNIHPSFHISFQSVLFPITPVFISLIKFWINLLTRFTWYPLLIVIRLILFDSLLKFSVEDILKGLLIRNLKVPFLILHLKKVINYLSVSNSYVKLILLSSSFNRCMNIINSSIHPPSSLLANNGNKIHIVTIPKV